MKHVVIIVNLVLCAIAGYLVGTLTSTGKEQGQSTPELCGVLLVLAVCVIALYLFGVINPGTLCASVPLPGVCK